MPQERAGPRPSEASHSGGSNLKEPDDVFESLGSARLGDLTGARVGGLRFGKRVRFTGLNLALEAARLRADRSHDGPALLHAGSGRSLWAASNAAI